MSFDDFVKEFEFELSNYNKIHNITRLKDIKKAANDSIRVLDFANFSDGFKVADVGSGAGFPAIFLAFCLKNCEFCLFEPSYKKAAFLSLIKAKFDLDNVRIVPKKVQEFNEFSFDIVTSRAFAKTKLIINLCDKISNNESKFIFYKGSFVDNELKCLEKYDIFEYENRKFLQFYKKNIKLITN